MNSVLILGAGKIGALISGLLGESGAYQVQMADVDATAAREWCARTRSSSVQAVQLDATDAAALSAHLKRQPVQAVVSGLPYHCNAAVAGVAREAGNTLFRSDGGRGSDPAGQRTGPRCPLDLRTQCGLAPGSSASPAARIRTSTRCAASGCASAHCPSIRTTYSSIPHLVDRRV